MTADGDHLVPGPEHLDPEVLGEHLEGLLAGDEARRADEHLGTCAECRDLADDLAAVAQRLAAQPPVGPMPDLVARRLDRALRAEVPLRPQALPDRPSGPRRRWLPAVAVAAAVSGALALGVPALLQSTGSDDSSAGVALDAGGEREAAASGSVGSQAGESPLIDTGAEAGGGSPAAESAGPAPPAAVLQERLDSLAGQDAALAPSGASGPEATARSAAGCALGRVNAVPGEVVLVEDAPEGAPGAVLVVVRTPDGSTAVLLRDCDPDAEVLGRATEP